MKIFKNYGFFTGIKIVDDNDWWPPFFAVSILKDLADELMKGEATVETDETKSRLERELGKLYYEFDGVDISLLILNIYWVDY